MSEKKVEDILAGMNPAVKKELLSNLVFALMSELNESEKKEMLQTVLGERKGSQRLTSMVEYWIKECTDSGVNPMEMSREVLSAVSQSYELATYSTPELRGLFNDWMGAIEQEMLEFLKGGNTADPEEVAAHFRLRRESIIFILGKMAREGKIQMRASGIDK